MGPAQQAASYMYWGKNTGMHQEIEIWESLEYRCHGKPRSWVRGQKELLQMEKRRHPGEQRLEAAGGGRDGFLVNTDGLL